MKRPDDPVRLGSDRSDAPPSLQRALRAASSHEPSDDELQSLARALGPILVPLGGGAGPAQPPKGAPAPPAVAPPAAAPLAAAAAGGGAVAIAKIVTGIALAGALVFGASRLLTTGGEPRSAAPGAVVTSERVETGDGRQGAGDTNDGRQAAVDTSDGRQAAGDTSVGRQATVDALPTSTGPEPARAATAEPSPESASPIVASGMRKPEPAPAKSSEAAAAMPAPVAPAASATTTPDRREPSEILLLRQARGALGADPARALDLAREHRRRFPSGALAQEREVIAIEALKRLGRADEAKARSDKFHDEYPSSIHDRAVETPPRDGGSR